MEKYELKSKVSMRDVFGETLLELGKINDKIVVVDSDCANITKASFFKKTFPKRFFDMGVAEQSMMGTAIGLASCGYIPFTSNLATFTVLRCFEYIRTFIAFTNLKVIIIGSYSGLSAGPNGPTHFTIEDISLMRSIPNMRVISPCDAISLKNLLYKAVELEGPSYFRISRNETKTIYNNFSKTNFYKNVKLKDGKDITIIATGTMVEKALEASNLLQEQYGIYVDLIDVHTIKPLEVGSIIDSVSKTKKVITVEEHSVIGGLGGAVSEILTEYYPAKLTRIGINDSFTETGDYKDLLEKYGLSPKNIVTEAKKLLKIN
ncbi:MAG: transketolase family protein [Actinobacteria bacterium]|nr:transketolase family protein [Actinomycetota bacterium]